MTDSQKLLAEYVQTGSEAAFRELVTRHVNLVYSAALRLVGGDTHRAEDVAQTVFVDLAGRARTLSPDVVLGGWLHRHTCFVAAKAMRGERRRRLRERRAVEMSSQQDTPRPTWRRLRPSWTKRSTNSERKIARPSSCDTSSNATCDRWVKRSAAVKTPPRSEWP